MVIIFQFGKIFVSGMLVFLIFSHVIPRLFLGLINSYTNVPLKEAVEIALRFYEQINPPEISRKAMKKLLNLAVSKVHIECNGLWYVQEDGLAMGTSLAVILTNLWLKGYEPALMKELPKLTALKEDNKKVCPRCQKKVTYRTKGVECEACLNWFGNISESEYAEIARTVWYCITCKKQQEADRTENGVKISLRFVDAIVRTVKGDPGVSSRQPISCIQTCSSP